MDLKVALISNEFPPDIFGGIGSFCYDLAHALSINEIPTIVFTRKSKKIKIEKINDYLKIIRFPCINLPPKHLWFQTQNFRIPLKTLKNYSIIHCIEPDISLMGSYLKRKSKKPLITSLHGIPSIDFREFFNSPISTWTPGEFFYNVLEYPLNEILFKHALLESDEIITCSYATLNDLYQTWSNIEKKEATVIHNAINFQNIDNIVENFHLSKNNDQYKIIFYGRLIWRKGIIYLLSAVKKLLNDIPNIKLNIFGKGPMEALLKKMIIEMDLTNSVFIKGFVKHAELIQNILLSDVVILPSLYEAQSVAMLEAMAFKKPIIAFDFPFTRECIKNYYNGLLAKSRDSDSLANKIKELLMDKNLMNNLGKNAYTYVKENHNWEKQIKKYIKIYEKKI